jgi:hypothetical protein
VLRVECTKCDRRGRCSEWVGADEPPKTSSRKINDRQTFHLLRWPSTSVSLEDAFWKGLQESVGARRMTLPKLGAAARQ